MAAKILRYLLYALTISSFLTAGYLNIVEVPEGNFGLLIEKTAGIQKPLLPPGRHWIWSGFIPDKWKLILVDRDPPVISVHFEKPLEQTSHLENRDIFTTKVTTQLKVRLSEEGVLFFYDYFDGDFNKVDEFITQRVALMLEIKFLEFYQSERDLPRLSSLYRTYFIEEDGFVADWSDLFRKNGIELIRHDLISVEVPELSIYRKHLQYSDAFLNARREAEIRNILADAKAHEIRITGQAELEKAEKFALLMQKYPKLLNYYRIEKLSDGSKVVVVDTTESASEISSQLVRPSALDSSPKPKSEPEPPQATSGSLAPITREK